MSATAAGWSAISLFFSVFRFSFYCLHVLCYSHCTVTSRVCRDVFCTHNRPNNNKHLPRYIYPFTNHKTLLLLSWLSISLMSSSYHIISYQTFTVRPLGLLRYPRPYVHYKSQQNARTLRKTQKSTNVKSSTKIVCDFSSFRNLTKSATVRMWSGARVSLLTRTVQYARSM